MARQLIKQLPAVFQTETLKKFFDSTIDQVFQPGESESLAGYIGSKPSYYDANKDFYIPEMNTSRQAYQLSPILVSKSGTAINRILFYDNYLDYLQTNFGNISDPNRLFSDEYYTWCPPINIDKIQNYNQYLWFGDDITKMPAVPIVCPKLTYTHDGSTTTYNLPPAITGLTSDDETIVVLIDTIPVEFTHTSTTITLTTTYENNATIDVWRYGIFKDIISGKSSFDLTPFTNVSVSATSSMLLHIDDSTTHYNGYGTKPYSATAYGADIVYDKQNNPYLYWVENVGSSIILIETNVDAYDPNSGAKYITSDRTTPDYNPWARNNYWTHKDAIAWSGLDFPSRIATRPIIEFISGLELYDFGITRKPDINIVLSGDPTILPVPWHKNSDAWPSNYDIEPWDTTGFEDTIAHMEPIVNAEGKEVYEVYINSFYPITTGDRVLVINNSNPLFNNKILTIETANISNVYKIVIEANDVSNIGDVVRLRHRGYILYSTETYGTLPYSYSDAPTEYWFDGNTWNESSQSLGNGDILFKIYDQNNNAIGSNRIFGYASGGTIYDSVLNRNLAYDANGNIVFSNEIASTPYQFYNLNGNKQNSWLKADNVSTQSLDGDVYTLPLNLTANADNQEIFTITSNQWFEQFREILAQNITTGTEYSANNYRDGTKTRNIGLSILQHKSPLLKAMLLASEVNFDYHDAIRFVDMEYIRFRNKFVQQYNIVLNSGKCLLGDLPSKWVDTILANLLIAKSPSFPFAQSKMAGGRYFIPPTAASMGILPAVKPRIEIDDTLPTPKYSQNIPVIIGHDGSRTPAFGDLRDTILLELETRIYNNISSKTTNFNEISLTSNYYTNGTYSKKEELDIMEPSFIRWVQLNALKYTTTNFVQNEPWTYNYSGVSDYNGNPLPGSWRAIYNLFFDTDRPHSHPWEMLGFADKPTWFDQEYGQAPYTKGNSHLWNDLRDGIIRRGNMAGTYTRWARPNLLSILPVDDSGKLIDPIACGICPGITYYQAEKSYEFGEYGPAEVLWRNSTSYQFAKCIAYALMRPATWIETMWDTSTYAHINNQWFDKETGVRNRAANVYVHGETINGQLIYKAGIQQWISDLMASRSQSASILGNAVRGIETRLAHRMAGFTQTSNIKAYADNFGILPSEDIKVLYYNAPQFKTSFYSGILIEWTGAGWKVVGYDNINQYFNIIPGVKSSGVSYVELGKNPVIYNWYPNVSYKVGQIVEYNNENYTCAVEHVSGKSFAQVNWTLTGELKFYPKAAVYAQGNGLKQIPYGTIFTNYQDICFFIRDYFRWLENEGFVFEGFENGIPRDWHLAITQYLEWTQNKWAPGSFIALSPAVSEISFVAPFGTFLSMEQQANGVYGLLNKTGKPIPQKNTFISRVDDTLKVICSSNDMFGTRIRLGSVEHVIVFSNKTIFNDILYEPLFNLWQPRLKLYCQRSINWQGRHNAPGFILSGNTMISNFDSAAENIRNTFDIEKSKNVVLNQYAKHMVGFDNKTYLDNLLISDTEQFEFYQGMIQQKGTPGVFNSLLRSDFIDSFVDMEFLEEWALKLTDYGNINKNSYVSFYFLKNDTTSKTQLITIGETHTNDDIIGLEYNDSRWIEKTENPNIFSYIEEIPEYLSPDLSRQIAGEGFQYDPLPSAGYARLTEVDFTVLSKTYYNTLYLQAINTSKFLRAGSRIWVYDRGDGDFSIEQIFSVGATLAGINIIDNSSKIRLTFSTAHNLDPVLDSGLELLISGATKTTPDASGIWKIDSVPDQYNIIVNTTSAITKSVDYTVLTNVIIPPVFVLRTMRFTDRTSAQNFWVRFTPSFNQRIFVDNAGNGKWAVYNWNGSSWIIERQQPQKMNNELLENVKIYDRSTIQEGQTSAVNEKKLPFMNVYDPCQGLVPGYVIKDLSYKTYYDPATYADPARMWGKYQVGQLWWNLSAVRFIDAQTDILDFSDKTSVRFQTEQQYRSKYWGNVAPGSSVQIYEWTRSLIAPVDYKTGQIFTDPSGAYRYVFKKEWNSASKTYDSVYYFWVLNPKTVFPGREDSAYALSITLANPKSNGLPWAAAVQPNAILVSGFQQYLNTNSTVCEITVKNKTEGEKHSEWLLVKPNDDTVLIPEYMLSVMRDSMTGIDNLQRPVPDPALTYPIGFSKTERKSMFDNMAGARQAFVQIVNEILYEKPYAQIDPNLPELLNDVHSDFKLLIWNGLSKYSSIEPVPANSYDYVVYSTKERNDLVRSGKLAGFSPNNVRLPRVLVIDLTKPSWTVYVIDTTKSGEEIFTIATNYDVVADSYNDMLTTNYAVGTRILVPGWKVYSYRPAIYTAVNGFVEESSQQYDCSKYWSLIDWYAPGYDSSMIPAVAYATLKDRDLAEQPVKNTFVKINNDGNGNWLYAKYTTEWEIVARQNGTLKFSDDLFKQMPIWEMRIIFDKLMQFFPELIRNKIFFSMLNYVFATQNFVPWAFKTSFLSINGFNEILGQSPILVKSKVDNLISYIEEVKPYHVRIRNYIQSLTPNVEQPPLHATDFDKPVWWNGNSYEITNDPSILSKDQWNDWYQNYATNSVIRHISSKVLFDRVSLTDGAYSRLISYNPSIGMEENNPEELMNLKFKGTHYQGSYLYTPVNPLTCSDYSIVGYGILPYDSLLNFEKDVDIVGIDTNQDININDISDRFALVSPDHETNRPEEQALSRVADNLIIRVKSDIGGNFYGNYMSASNEISLSMMGNPYMGSDYGCAPYASVPYSSPYQVWTDQRTTLAVDNPIRNSSLGYLTGLSGTLVSSPWRPLFELTGSYKNIKGVAELSLAAQLNNSDTSISINVPSTSFLPASGIIHIGAERIYYTDVSYNGLVATLNKFERGYKGTPIGKEQRLMNSYTANGTNKTFALTGSTTGYVDVMVFNGNTKSVMMFGNDYTQSVSGSNINVVLKNAPANGAKVFVSQTTGIFYNSGEPVYCYEGDTNNFNKSIVVGNANTNLGVLTTLANAGPNNIDAYKFVPNTTSGIHNVYYGWAADTGETYTAKVDIKSGGVRYILINCATNLNKTVCVDTTNGTILQSGSNSIPATIASIGNGWFRIVITGTGSGTDSIYLQANNSYTTNNSTYSGNGTDYFEYSGLFVYKNNGAIIQ